MQIFSEKFSDIDLTFLGMELVMQADEIPLIEPIERMGRQFLKRCGPSDEAFDLVYVSKADPPLGLFCSCHGHLGKDKITHFQLTLARKPADDPPVAFQETSDILGGFDKGLKDLFMAFDGLQFSAKVQFDILLLDTKKWPLKFKKRRVDKKHGAFEFEKEELKFSSEEKNMEIDLIYYSGSPKCIIRIKLDEMVTLDKDCFERVAGSAWNEIQSFVTES